MQQHDKSSDAERDFGRTPRQRRTAENREAVAVPSNTATNNSINGEVKFLRWGIDSLYLSYQGNLHPHINQQLKLLKTQAQSENPVEQSKAQIKVGEHLFEVKDKGTSMFNYVIEDNAFRIQLSRPGKAVPMAYVKLSSEYLTYKTPAQAEASLVCILSELGVLEFTANVSRVDMFVDFISYQDMESWPREAWVTHASAVSAYAVDNRFTGWAIGLGGVMAGRLYDKKLEIIKSHKDYLAPLWLEAGWQMDDPVWRLEFEFKRELLAQKNIPKLSDVLNNLNGLWSYATTEWLKLTIPNTDDKTRSRWPIHPMWASLAALDWETNGGPLQSRFSLSRLPNNKAVLSRAFSALISWMATQGHTDYDQCIHLFFEELTHHINNKSMNIGASFESYIKEKVAQKARLFNTIDVNGEIYYSYVDEEIRAIREYEKQSNGE